MRQNHAFGLSCGMSDEEILQIRSERPIDGSYLLTSREKAVIMDELRSLHEEVVLRGFYNPDLEIK